MSEELSHCKDEIEMLQLLKEVREQLAKALDSLAGKTKPTLEAGYLGWAGMHVNRAVHGYIELREAFMVYASKILVRPALEAIFAALAIMKQRGIYFRQAAEEIRKESLLLQTQAEQLEYRRRSTDDLESEIKKTDPQYPFCREKIRVEQLAEFADVPHLYKAYRIYCAFTHGSIRALEGGLNEVSDPRDTLFMIWCALVILDQLKTKTPAMVPDLTPYIQRLPKLD